MPLYDPIHDTMVEPEHHDAPTQQPTQPPQTLPPFASEVSAIPVHSQPANTLPMTAPDSALLETATATTPVPLAPVPETTPLNGHKHTIIQTPRATPSKKQKKNRGGNNRGATVLSSARSRHLKKEDGEPFWRKDIQYAFLKALFDNNVKAFTDPFPDSPENVNMDDREHDPEGRLSFAELYIKSISHSSKCSKVLKERLLNDMKMSIPTCMICLLVNVGRMNTTINFVPDMKSQLRTYHPIPSLQVNYDSATTGNDKSNDKQLQDTPRLKSILKACCDDTHEPQSLEKLETLDKLPMTTVVNMIFVLCNSEDEVLKKFFNDTPYYFYDIFTNAGFDPKSRSELFLWLLYNYLETHLTEEDMSKNPFGATKPVLKAAVMDHDIDSELEREFGDRLREQRVRYLADEPLEKPVITKPELPSTWRFHSESGRDQNFKESVETEDHEYHQENEQPLEKSFSSSDATQKSASPAVHHIVPVTNTQPLRQDIDVSNIRRVLKGLRQRAAKQRHRKGMVQHENFLIHRAGVVDDDASNRLRLKNYKGDYAEYQTKFHKLFTYVKNKFYEIETHGEPKDTKSKIESKYSESPEEPLKLTSFDIGI